MRKNKAFQTTLLVGSLLIATGIAVAGGNTIAGSERSQTLAFEGVRTLASGLSDLDENGTDVCTTIVNRSENEAVIRLTLTDVFDATVTMDINKSKSSALCEDETEAVSVECMGPKKCAFTWSIDRF